jgi:hypothetical protein
VKTNFLLGDSLRDRMDSFDKPAVSKKSQFFQIVTVSLLEFLEMEPQEKGILFVFVKRKIESGELWKLQKVFEEMKAKGINSLRYFMAACKDLRE